MSGFYPEPRHVGDILPEVVDDMRRRIGNTSKTYEGLARVLRSSRPTETEFDGQHNIAILNAALAQWQIDVRVITRFLNENNPNFNADEFIALLENGRET